jgi:dTDP-4-amino-4,6-dideoxygalactose transaminase
MKIPFSPPDIGEEEIAGVVDTLRSGWITTGPKTKKFEEEIAQWCHTKRAVCLSSATACMEMTLRLLGIGKGDEVIVTAYTYTASASVICHVGATPVLIDTAKDSFQMDYDAMEEAITAKTKAIIPVDFAGVMCDYERIFHAVENKRELFVGRTDLQKALGRVIVLADCAHGFGATYKGKPAGSVADFTSFSFHAVKNLTTAEGGAVTWRELPGVYSDDIYTKYMLLTLHGQSKDALAKTKLGSWEYDIITPAYKCNMTDINAAIGLAQLHRYPEMLKRRHEIIDKYNMAFKDLPITPLVHYTESVQSSGHLYIMRLDGKGAEERNRFIEKLAEKEVASNVHYKPLPMLTAYDSLGFEIEKYPNAFAMYENEVTLPLHTCLTDEQIDYVIESVKEVLE